MTSVYLYGELRNKFGEEFNFKINSPKEAFVAINANRKGFLDEIKKEALKGVLYRIVIDEKIVEDKSDLLVYKVPKEIHIVPVVWGAGKNSGGILMLAAGIALIAVTGGAAALGLAAQAGTTGLLTATTAAGVTSLTTLGSVVAMLGAGLAVQGIMSLLYPPPKPDFNQEVQAGGKSYLFGNRQNNVSQGQAVPVGYGRLLIGSSQVSSSTSHYSLKEDMRALMTPTDKPIDDFIELDFRDEAPGVIKTDSFYTNQSSRFDDTPSFSSINILNSYINITTKSADKIYSTISEAIVRTDGVIVSNPNLTSFNEDVTFSWSDLDPQSNRSNIQIDNPYAFDQGLVYRTYRARDFDLTTRLEVSNSSSSYFASYDADQLVSFGPTQFQNLNFQTWDTTYTYVSGELIRYDTGDGAWTFYRAITGGSGNDPTGLNGTSYWEQITTPTEEKIYRCLNNNTKGYLPTDPAQWYEYTAPTTSGEMNSLINRMGVPNKENVYAYDINNINPFTADGSQATIENSVMEFLGYFYVPMSPDLEIDAVSAVDGTMYEITKVGDTNWSSIGVVGTPAVGTTFTKNSTAATGSGKVHPVIKYKFTLDCDDGADLYIDGQRVAYKYGEGGLSLPTNNAGIQALPATTNSTVVKLTTGYHRLYSRLYNRLKGSGLTLYFQYDSNWDGNEVTGENFSNWAVIPSSRVFNQKGDLSVTKDTKFLSKITSSTITLTNGTSGTLNFVTGKKYKIIALGDVNWNSIGASSATVGSLFVKNSTTATGSGSAYENVYSVREAKSANANRLVRFTAQRPRDNNTVSSESAIYRASFQCSAQVGRVNLYSAPVKIYMKFLPVSANLSAVSSNVNLSIEAQI